MDNYNIEYDNTYHHHRQPTLPRTTNARWLPIYVNARTNRKVLSVCWILLCRLYCDNIVTNLTLLLCMCFREFCYEFSMILKSYVQYCVGIKKCLVLNCDYYLCSEDPIWVVKMPVVG